MNKLSNKAIGEPVEPCPLLPDFAFDDEAIDPPLLTHTVEDEPPPQLQHRVATTDQGTAAVK